MARCFDDFKRETGFEGTAAPSAAAAAAAAAVPPPKQKFFQQGPLGAKSLEIDGKRMSEQKEESSDFEDRRGSGTNQENNEDGLGSGYGARAGHHQHDARSVASSSAGSRGGPPGLLRRPRPAELPAQEAPVQLISVSRVGDSWRFEAKEEALKLLESYGQRPVSVCSVCGPARAGKSFLLNLLVGRMQGGHVSGQFQVGNTSEACTNGLWLWGTGPSGVLFLDCEGFESTDGDSSRDVRLMSLCMLISSVFVLNTKGVLNESLLKMASLVCHAAENLESQIATMNSNVSVNRPALLWLLRDFVLDLSDEEGHTMTPDEYLETTLHTRPQGNNSGDAGATREVNETLMRSFPHRGCSTLVQPATEESDLQRLADLPYEDLRAEFRRGLEALQARILSPTLGSGKVVGGQPLSGLALSKLLRRLVESMNSHSLISLGSAWDDVQYHGCEALSQELEEKIKGTCKACTDGVPLPALCGLQMPVRDDMLGKGEMESELCEEQKQQQTRDDTFKGLLGAKSLELGNKKKMSEQNEDQLAETTNALTEAKTELASLRAQLSKERKAAQQSEFQAQQRFDMAKRELEESVEYWKSEAQAFRARLSLSEDGLHSTQAAVNTLRTRLSVSEGLLSEHRQVSRARHEALLGKLAASNRETRILQGALQALEETPAVAPPVVAYPPPGLDVGRHHFGRFQTYH